MEHANQKHHNFTWQALGDIPKGRGDLGTDVPVLVYRLMQYTMLDILSRAHGIDRANDCFREAGHLAGLEFAAHTLDLTASLPAFVAQLQRRLRELKIGILRVEFLDEVTGEMILTIGEDLDCSGLPVSDEVVCAYDEGFCAGILEAYTGKVYSFREVDCWSSGDRVCRFHGVVVGSTPGA